MGIIYFHSSHIKLSDASGSDITETSLPEAVDPTIRNVSNHALVAMSNHLTLLWSFGQEIVAAAPPSERCRKRDSQSRRLQPYRFEAFEIT